MLLIKDESHLMDSGLTWGFPSLILFNFSSPTALNSSICRQNKRRGNHPGLSWAGLGCMSGVAHNRLKAGGRTRTDTSPPTINELANAHTAFKINLTKYWIWIKTMSVYEKGAERWRRACYIKYLKKLNLTINSQNISSSSSNTNTFWILITILLLNYIFE